MCSRGKKKGVDDGDEKEVWGSAVGGTYRCR